MQIRLFGPMEVLDDTGRPIDVGTRKQRAVLAMLATEPGRVVSLDRLIDELWAGEAPASATGTLQAYISHLRRALEPDRPPRTPPSLLLTREPGYLLAVAPGRVDLARFAAWAADGHRALARREYERARQTLDDALALWRGEPLAEFVDDHFAAPTIARLSELRGTAEEDRFEARLAIGDAAACVADLERLVGVYPYRERLHGLLALALYRSERQADALDVLRRARGQLAELGLSPGPELQRLEHAILNQDPDLAPPRSAPPAVAAAGDTGSAPERLIGRGAQLERIDARLAALREGRGGVLLIVGDAGIGKTRLATIAADEAAARGMTVAWGRCVDTATAPAFWPWIEVLRDTGTGAEAVRLLSGDPSGSTAGRVDFELFELYQRVLAALGAAGPVVVVLDDLHWADQASLRLLSFVAGELDRRPVLVVGTLRPEPGEHPEQLRDTLGALAREHGTERVEVRPLTGDDVAAYLRARHADPRLAPVLHERSGGNPFYLGELVRLLGSEHRLSTAVPAGVRDVIARRLGRLPADCVTLLEIAAAAGHDVDPDLLAAVGDTPIEDVLTHLEPAVAAGLLVEAGDDYRFAHALVRDALYAGLSRARAALLHLRIGEWLESLTLAGPTRAAELAHHFSKAVRVGGRAKAVEYASRAARTATAQLAYDEAVRFWELAGTCLAPDDAGARCSILVELGRARRAVGDADGARRELEQAMELARRLGDRAALVAAVTVFSGPSVWHWRPYGTVDERMVATLEDLLAGPLDDRDRAALLGALGVELVYGPRRAEGERLAAEGVELARRIEDPVLTATTLNNYYISAWVPGREPQRLAAANEMLALPGLPRATELVATVLRMACLLRAGELAAWDRDFNRCERLLAEIGRAELEPMVRIAESARRTLDGDWAAAEELASRFRPVEYGASLWGPEFPRLLTRYAALRGQGRVGEILDELVAQAADPELTPLRPTAVLAALECDRPDLARELIARWGTAVPEDWATDFQLVVWGFIAARLGDPDLDELYRQLLPHADALVVSGMGMCGWGSYHQVLARLAHGLGHTDRARDHARRAVEIHRRLGLAYWEKASLDLLESLGSG